MGKIITVVSGKGGTGKTTAVGALASCLGVMGRKVLCIDCDSGLRNLDITLGMTNYTAADFSHVINGEVTLDEACSCHPDIENLWFLSAPPTYDGSFPVEGAEEFFAEIREKFDYCLIDAPAGIGSGFKFTAQFADMAIIVATGDASSMRGGQSVTMALRKEGIADIRLIVNRVRPKLFRAVGATVDNVIDVVGAQLLAVVREDPLVGISANLETPLVLMGRKKASRAFLRAAQRLENADIPVSM